MAVRTRQDLFACDTRIDTTQIVPASRLVANITGFAVQPNKAIVGANAFAHESGIHQDGVLKSRETYEIMRAEDVGWNANKLVLGKHSGRSAFRSRLQDLGIQLESDQAVNAAFARFKDLADKKHEISVTSRTAFIPDQSDLESGRYVFAYTITITNTGSVPAQLVSRHWVITDANNLVQEVKGQGVVGAQPYDILERLVLMAGATRREE